MLLSLSLRRRQETVVGEAVNYWRLGLNTVLLKKRPISLIHLVTRRCNARCKHCFIDFEHPLAADDELSTEEIARLTRTFGDELFSVYLTGGEPFLREDMFEIVAAYCRNTAVESVNIATNGTYTEAVGHFLDQFLAAGLGKRLMFSISIDDLADAHDSNRNVPGLYRKAVATYKLIEAYKNIRIIPTVAMTVTSYNYRGIVDAYRSLRASGITSFTAILMREQGVVKAVEQKAEVLRAHRELVRLIQADQSKGATVGTGADILGCYVNARNDVFNRLLPDIYLPPRKSFDCAAGTLFGVIFPNGDVTPCEMQERFVLGNLRDYDMNFAKLWNSRKARAIYRDMRAERCACTFDGAWAINLLANKAFLPRLLLYFARNLVQLAWLRQRPGG